MKPTLKEKGHKWIEYYYKNSVISIAEYEYKGCGWKRFLLIYSAIGKGKYNIVLDSDHSRKELIEIAVLYIDRFLNGTKKKKP